MSDFFTIHKLYTDYNQSLKNLLRIISHYDETEYRNQVKKLDEIFFEIKNNETDFNNFNEKEKTDLMNILKSINDEIDNLKNALNNNLYKLNCDISHLKNTAYFLNNYFKFKNTSSRFIDQTR